jgi:hypothetical protein
MSAVITSIAAVKEAATEEGFRLFCEERGIDPDAFAEPEEGVMIDSFDLLRYGMDETHDELKADVEEIVGPRM